MSLFSDNIKYLRARKNASQREVAEGLQISRDRYAKYEDGKNSPPPEILLMISRYFHISIDLLLSVDLTKIPTGDLLKLGDNRILLPITVDRNGDNYIEIIPHKARAGYLTGYADPEFIENLPQISLPFLGSGKFRAFPIGGDSMPPHDDQAYIVGRYVENLGEVRKDKTYILITVSEGMTYKRISEKSKDAITVESDNIIYNPYSIKLSDIVEIWEYAAHIGRNDSKPELTETESVTGMFMELKRDINEIRKKIE